MNEFEIAARAIKHPSVRWTVTLNLWKISTWREFAMWKKHGRRFVLLGAQHKRNCALSCQEDEAC